MLTEGAQEYLRSLTFNCNAERQSCIIPMGGIYWSDEVPDFHALMNIAKPDRDQIYRLFAIRFKLWADEVLTHDDQTYLSAAIQQVPNNPIFQRLCISDDDRAAQAAAEQDAIAGFEALFGDADSFKINQDGSFTATFDLTKD